VGGQRHTPATLPPGKTQYPLYSWVGMPQDWSVRVRKISPPPGFDPWTIQPVAISYTDCPLPAQQNMSVHLQFLKSFVTIYIILHLSPGLEEADATCCS
jgi:hypothetical protein